MSCIGTLGAGDWFFHDSLQVEGVVTKQLPHSTVVQLRKRELQPDLVRDLDEYTGVAAQDDRTVIAFEVTDARSMPVPAAVRSLSAT